MINNIDMDKCTGCTACVNICPLKCIDMKENEEGFLYPIMVAENQCVKCGKCLKVCQAYSCDDIEMNECESQIYVCQNKLDSERIISTAGGVFSIIAKHFIEQGGVVFGAILNKEFECIHSNTDSCEFKSFSESKYVQSNLEDSYFKVKKYLDENRMVCFSGTPCQVMGLKKYLGRPYDNLLLVDLLCHGVPSPGVFRKYRDYLLKKYKKNGFKEFHFRSKVRGYKNSSIKAVFDDDSVYLSGIECDQYLRLFFSDIILRKACYQCSFRKKERIGDITLFDCWHIGLYHKYMDDNRGTTSLMVNNHKGKKILENIASNMIIEPVDAKQCLSLDGDMTYRVINEPSVRKGFFSDFVHYDYKCLLGKYVPIKPINYVKRFAKNFLFYRKKFDDR